MPYKQISVIEESDSGRNKRFIDNKTKRIMTRSQFATKIDKGEYQKYHTREVNGLTTPVSNPDNKEGNNLG